MDEAGGLKRMSTITNISFRALLVAGVFALALTALFMRAAAPGITFALESDLNLTIGSNAFRNGIPVPGSTWTLKDLVPGTDKFFNLANVMPGDSGKATISMHVESRQSGAWLCLDFSSLQSDDNGVNEPEEDADPNGAASGELANEMEFFAWRDDGDDDFEAGEAPLFDGPQSASEALNEKTYAVADALSGSPVETGGTRAIGIAWCAGNLEVNLGTAQLSCDAGALGNEAQTDSLSVDVSIRAALEREQPTFTCSGEVVDGRGRPERPERPERPTR